MRLVYDDVYSRTLCSDVRSTSWNGAGSILQLLKLTCSSSCSSSHSAICKTFKREKGQWRIMYCFRLQFTSHNFIGPASLLKSLAPTNQTCFSIVVLLQIH